MKGREKILSGYLILTLVFSFGVLVCFLSLGPIKNSVERLVDENLPVLNLIQDIRTQGSLLHAEQLKVAYLLALDSSISTEKTIGFDLAELRRTRGEIQEEVQEYKRLVELYFSDEIQFIPRLQTQVDQLIDLSDQLEKLALEPFDTLKQLQGFQFETIEEGFLAITAEIVSHEMQEISARREFVDVTLVSARYRIGLAYLISLGLALFLAILLARWLYGTVEK